MCIILRLLPRGYLGRPERTLDCVLIYLLAGSVCMWLPCPLAVSRDGRILHVSPLCKARRRLAGLCPAILGAIWASLESLRLVATLFGEGVPRLGEGLALSVGAAVLDLVAAGSQAALELPAEGVRRVVLELLGATVVPVVVE